MEEENIINQSEDNTITQPVEVINPTSDTFVNKYLTLIEGRSIYFKISAIVIMSAVIITVTSFLYFKIMNSGLLNSDPSEDQNINNLSYKEKEDILKSLSDNSIQSEISLKEKHKELDQLSKQPEDVSQLRDFEKVDILKKLSQ